MGTENTTPEPIVEERDDGTVLFHDPEDEQTSGTGTGTGTEGAGTGTGTGAPATGDASHRERTDDDEAADEAAAAAGANEAEREAIRARRRAERAQRKAAQREREDNLRNELRAANQQIQALQEGFAQMQRRMTGTDLAQLDAAAKRASDTADYYKSIIAEATKKQDGDAVAAATEAMLNARNEAQRLEGIKKSLTQQSARPAPSAIDPRMASQAQAWLSRNSWYSPQSNDVDAQVLRALDNALANEGFDPRTESYWQELDARVGRYLPHRASAGGSAPGGGSDYTPGTTAQGRQRTPVAGSGREGQSAGGAGQPAGGQAYQLSAARVQALKEAGMWDDPKTRAEMIRRYRDADRAAAAARQS